jgi:chemotaxis protein methyltransferase CheR
MAPHIQTRGGGDKVAAEFPIPWFPMEEPAMEEDRLKQARDLIADRIGLLVQDHDDAQLRKVIVVRLKALELPNIDAYCRFLLSDEDMRREREVLAVLLTTGETYFFRDGGQHALLQDRLLPELLERRKEERALRIWCAACSSGEEAYSLAILLDELLADQSHWKILILGTDINPGAIEKARRGIYTDWSFRGMSGERRQRYFHQHKNAWALDERIRARVTFRQGDLVADEFPNPDDLHDFDLILCRNTFIYMTAGAVSGIVAKFADTLVDGGILITGHGELHAHGLGKLQTRVFPESIVYQKLTVPAPLPAPDPTAGMRRQAPKMGHAALPAMHSANAAASKSGETLVSAMQRAWQFANQGQWDRAEKLCRGMIAKNALLAEPHYLLALLAQERGDFADAKDLLKKALYLDPTFVAAYLDLGDLYAREDDGVRARKMHETARDLLRALPGDEQAKFYGGSTVDALLRYVEHLLHSHD